ncbi:hypothetical protein GCM10009648_14760 [Tsukamurella spumae]
MLTATIHGSRGTLRTTLIYGPNNSTKERPASDTADTTIIPLSHPIHQRQGASRGTFDTHGAQRRWHAHLGNAREISGAWSGALVCWRDVWVDVVCAQGNH